jgi:hypothetical protein
MYEISPFSCNIKTYFILFVFHSCHNLSLGLATKARAYKGAGQERSSGVTFMLPGVQKSVREWTLTLPRELPLWELESWWTPESSESDCKGENSLNWDVPYIIGKLLERRCLKWVCMTHLDIWNTSYGQKSVQVTCHISLESSQWELQLCFRPHFNWRSANKVMGMQSCGNP